MIIFINKPNLPFSKISFGPSVFVERQGNPWLKASINTLPKPSKKRVK